MVEVVVLVWVIVESDFVCFLGPLVRLRLFYLHLALNVVFYLVLSCKFGQYRISHTIYLSFIFPLQCFASSDIVLLTRTLVHRTSTYTQLSYPQHYCRILTILCVLFCQVGNLSHTHFFIIYINIHSTVVPSALLSYFHLWFPLYWFIIVVVLG